MTIQEVAALALASGPVLGVVAEAARRVPMIPFDPKTKAGMRLAVSLASVAAGGALAYLDGNLSTFNIPGALEAILAAIAIYQGAVTTHDHALKTNR